MPRQFRVALTTVFLFAAVWGCSDHNPSALDNHQPQLAPNGWPISHAPDGYTGTGYAIGDLVPDFVASDQFGHDDVELTQFYGATLILHLGGTWCMFCLQSDQHLPATMDSLNGLYDNMTFWVFDVFDYHSSMDSARAADHAAAYGIDYPVLYGAYADTVTTGFEVSGYPTFVFLDPELRIRARFSGGGTNPAPIISAARAAADSFLSQNPAWKSPFK